MTAILITITGASDALLVASTRASIATATTLAHEVRVDEEWGAAALNRAFRETTAGIVVLLECGVTVDAGWLEALVAALEHAGIAGPSTNRAWNEQQCEPDPHSTQVRTLAPLYSLGDFCYAIRREVFEAIGPADEGYGLGPCWEMDYNIRAARAGFDGVWVRAAYVRRAPVSAQRVREEAVRFEANKRRYQDKFCGARLRGAKTSYRAHCRGDACPNFAPHADARPPLVTCVMPTFNRRAFIPLALDAFRNQTHANRELIVVDDGTDAIDDLLRDQPDVRYIRCDQRLTVGAKRNLGCEAARGDFIAMWDDDDWYGSKRLERQLAPILAARADVTGLVHRFVLQLPQRKCWSLSRVLHRSMFAGGVTGGTLVFRRSLWSSGIRFPDVNLGEDAAFLRTALARRARLARVEDEGDLFIYVRHGANTWRFDAGSFVLPAGWSEAAPPPALTSACVDAYAAAAHEHAQRWSA